MSGLENLERLYCGYNLISVLKLPDTSVTEKIYLDCSHNQITQLGHTTGYAPYNVSVYNGPLVKQVVSGLSVQNDTADQSYPFCLDMSVYVSPDNFVHIEADSVKGFDENNAEIASVYENGIARFASSPVKVAYRYDTGFVFLAEEGTNITLDVTIGGIESAAMTLNNHVYRIFNRDMNWENAKDYCESLGGHLAILTTSDEIGLINDMLDNERRAGNYPHKSYWLGAERQPEDTDHYNTYHYGDHSYDYLFYDGYTNQYDDSEKWHWVDGTEFSGEISLDNNNYYEGGDSKGLFNYFGDLRLLRSLTGEFVPLNKYVLRSFICEWEPASADFIPLLPEDTTPRGDDFTGYLQDPRDLSNLMPDPPRVSVPVLPAKFDPREEGRKLPEVRNQGNYGTCWSFASIGALEASYMTKFGSTADLSELHQAWYVYKDPRVGYSQKLNDPSKHVLNQGGWASLSIHFLSGIGPASEESFKYDDATISDIERLTAGRYPENYPHPVRLSDAYELGDVTSENRDAMMTIIKNLVYENGAIEVGYNTNRNNPGYNLTSTNYYLPSSIERTGGHAVQIVGWDDNYPRNDFKNTPSINGAWLIKNSWGSNWEENGYFWLSYEQDLHNVSAYIAAQDTGARMYGHDALSARHAYVYRWGASVFRAAGNESLNAVSFYTRENNVPYKIYVKTHGKEAPTTEDFGIPEEPDAEGTQDYAGYHTVNLASPVSLKAGDYFSVILNFGGTLPLMVMEDDNDSGEDKTSVITAAGRCYFSNSKGEPEAKEWVDGKSILGGSFNGSIRAFTNSGSESFVEAVSITTSSLPDGVVGQEYTATLEASSTSKVQWSVSGLPDGLSCEENEISGIPTTEGVYSISVTARNDGGRDFKRLNLTIKSKESPDDPDNPVNPNTPDNPDTPNNPYTPYTPNNPDNPNNPDTPNNPNNPGISGSSGGGGCEASSIPTILGVLALAFTLTRKK